MPSFFNPQKAISVGTAAYEGTGQFQLAIVNADASQTYWRKAPDPNNPWSAMNTANPPSARYAATAVCASDRLFVWGGQGMSGSLNTSVSGGQADGQPVAASQNLNPQPA